MADDEKNDPEDNDLEEIFEKTWKNWESRRRCEKTHVPECLKRKNKRS